MRSHTKPPIVSTQKPKEAQKEIKPLKAELRRHTAPAYQPQIRFQNRVATAQTYKN